MQAAIVAAVGLALLIAAPLGAGGTALGFALALTIWILRQDEGSEQVQFIGRAIRQGARAFLSLE